LGKGEAMRRPPEGGRFCRRGGDDDELAAVDHVGAGGGIAAEGEGGFPEEGAGFLVEGAEGFVGVRR